MLKDTAGDNTPAVYSIGGNMKKILLILVGGTICTALNEEGNLAVSEKAGVLLKEKYLNSDSPYAKSVIIDSTENLYILSENMTIDRWNLIIDTYRKYSAATKYDGIVMAHGTDTLAYSASLFSMLLSTVQVPVFLVSANENLQSDRTNGNANFRCAIECICRGITPNVYVPYKNLSDNQMYLHLASRLRQCENYSEDFHSVGAINLTDISDDNYVDYFKKIEKAFPEDRRKKVVDISGDWKLRECILAITPYVGINYACYDYQKFSAVLHGTFHSGTACVEKSEKKMDYGEHSILYMLDRCLEMDPPIDVYYSPAIFRTGTYETVAIVGNHKVNGKGIRFMYGVTNEMAYAKLVIAYSLFESDEERCEFINGEYNFEMIDVIK